jgi:hypothetical protein
MKRSSSIIIMNNRVPGLTTVGMLLDVVVWRLGRKLDLYREMDTKRTKADSRNHNFQQLK